MIADDEDDDYIPESLADFLKQADAALDEHTQMFMDEFSPSPTPNQSTESTDYEISNLDELQANMQKVSILDKPSSAAMSTRSDDYSDFASPVARNPAADLTFTDVKRSILGGSTPIEEKKAPSGNLEAAEDSIQTPTKVVASPDINANQIHLDNNAKPQASPESTSREAKSSFNDNSGANTLVASASKVDDHVSAFAGSPGSLKEAAASSPVKSPNQVGQVGFSGNDEPKSAALSPLGYHHELNSSQSEAEAKLVTSPEGIDTSPQPDHPAVSQLVVQDDTGLSFASSKDSLQEAHRAPSDGGDSHLEAQGDKLAGHSNSAAGELLKEGGETEYDDSAGLPQLEVKQVDTISGGAGNPNLSLEPGTPSSIDSKGGSVKAINDEPEAPASTGLTVDKPETADSQPVPEKAEVQQESRSLFGAFTSFARAVVPSSKVSKPDTAENAPTNTSEQASGRPASPTQSVSSTEEMMQAGPLASPNVDTFTNAQARSRPTASPTQSLSSTEEMMQHTVPAHTESSHPNADKSMEAQLEQTMPGPSPSLPSTGFIGFNGFDPTSATNSNGAMTIQQRFPQEFTNDANMAPATASGDEMLIDPPSETNAMVAESPEELHSAMFSTTTDAHGKMQVETSSPSKEELLKATASADSSEYVGGSITTYGSLAQRKETPKHGSARTRTVSAAKAPATKRALVSPKSRLVQPTASSKRHTHSTEKRAVSTPTSKVASRGATPPSGKRSTPTQIPVPATVRIKANIAKRPATTPLPAKNRFMQPTVSKRAHTADSGSKQSSSAAKRTAGASRVPSRLMKGTAASTAKAPSVLPKTRNVSDDAVARARERVRLRKLQDAKPSADGSPKFNMGTKPKEKPRSSKGSPRFLTPTSATRAHQNAPNVSMAQSAVFFGRVLRGEPQTAPSAASSRRRGLTVPVGPTFTSSRLGTSRITQPTASAKAHQKAATVPMARSADLFGKGLRSEPAPAKKARPALTVPKGPSFLERSSKKANHGKTVSLAQSTNLLANTLRGYDSAPTVKRSTGLTQPQAPKFHTTHKRALPKSSVEIEEEKLRNFRARPFKSNQAISHTGANQNSLHTGSSAGLSRVAKRGLTKPAPFKLSSAPHTTRTKPTEGSPNPQGGTKMFRARPMPQSSNAGQRKVGTKQRTVTAPQPFRFAVDMKSKTNASGRNKVDRSSPPKAFKARPLPKSTFSPSPISVQKSTSPSSQVGASKKQRSNGQGFSALPYNGPPPPPAATAKHGKSPTTPEPFQLESVKRHDAFQELLQEKVASEEEEFKRNLCPKALPLPESTYTPDLQPSPAKG